MSKILEIIFTGGTFKEFWNALLHMFGLDHPELGELFDRLFR